MLSEAIDSSLSDQHAGFPLMIVPGKLTPDIQSAANANERANSNVGEFPVPVQGVGRRYKSAGGRWVRCEKSCRGPGEGKQPRAVVPRKSTRARPDRYLIRSEVSNELKAKGVVVSGRHRLRADRSRRGIH